MLVSIIIPTYNEAENIAQLIGYLKNNSNDLLLEIIVSDGGSGDNTLALAEQEGAIALNSPEKGRAAQMNYGASVAKGDLLYFVHADTIPPQSYLADITQAVSKGYAMGRYLSSYDSKSWLLKLNAFLSRLDTFAGMGGDQTLFITKKLFKQTGGFDGGMKIMEEFEFCARARNQGKYKIIHKPVLISARKYDSNGWLKVQRANYTVVRMYQKGASQQDLAATYKKMLNYR
ncbi:TIGR04283 family arsenosugar biosynthesis glycosyltransferase [Mucilaginibacter sp. UYCu711]|uniref:TIGR04283 family arsenosugar biosynthesis glycosyltransferase n=1 Tax=Mucilaginibacter sp. UYCu711 TaxID=3156339 RepID=UPI003D1E252A